MLHSVCNVVAWYNKLNVGFDGKPCIWSRESESQWKSIFKHFILRSSMHFIGRISVIANVCRYFNWNLARNACETQQRLFYWFFFTAVLSYFTPNLIYSDSKRHITNMFLYNIRLFSLLCHRLHGIVANYILNHLLWSTNSILFYCRSTKNPILSSKQH